MHGAKQVFIAFVEKGVSIMTIDGIQVFKMPAVCAQESARFVILPSSHCHRIGKATSTHTQLSGER